MVIFIFYNYLLLIKRKKNNMKIFLILFLIIGSAIIKCQDSDNFIPKPRCLMMEGPFWIRAEYFESLASGQMIITQVTHNTATKKCTFSCHKYTKTEMGPSNSEKSDAEYFTVIHLMKQINNYIAERNK